MKKLDRQIPTFDVSRRARIARAAVYALVFAFFLSFGSALLGQQVPGALKTEPSNPNEKPTFWLLDEHGKWRVPLPNWSLEDVMRTIDAQEEERSRAPYSIREVTATGSVVDGLARLKIKFTIYAADGVTSAPLGLSEGVYIPTAEQEASGESRNGGFSYQGPGVCTLEVDPNTGEYVAVLRSTQRRNHRRSIGETRNENAERTNANEHGAESDSNANGPAAQDGANVNADARPNSETPSSETSAATLETEGEGSAKEVAPNESAADEQRPESANVEENSQEKKDEPSADGQEKKDEPSADEQEKKDEPSADEQEKKDEPSADEQEKKAEPSADEQAEPTARLNVPSKTAFARPTFVSASTTGRFADLLDPEGRAETNAALEGASNFEPVEQEETETARGEGAAEPQYSRRNQYVLTLELAFVVETVGVDEYRLSATFPYSPKSELTLTTPTPNVRVSSVKGAIATHENPAELKLRGLGRGGERMELVWQKVEQNATETQTTYQVEDASIGVMLSARETTYDATLPIRVFGGESNVFYVLLPENADLDENSVAATGANGAMFAIQSATECEKPSEGYSGAPEGRYAKILLEQKTAAATLKLKARVSTEDEEVSAETNAENRRPVRQIEGFTVLSAQKQYGQVTISKTEELGFDVASTYGAALSASTNAAENSETYSFYSQPFLLTVQSFKRQTIVNVKPEYQARIGIDGVELRARFRFSIYGAKTRDFKFNMNGWNSAKIVDSPDLSEVYDDLQIGSDGTAVVSLKRPTDGEVVFEMKFAADAEVGDGKSFAMELPIPIANWVESGALVVVPDNNVKLDPAFERCDGLAPKSSRALALEMELPKTVQNPLYFQTRQVLKNASDERKTSRFEANATRLYQNLYIEALTAASIVSKDAMHVRQDFTYNIENEPLESIELRVPKELVDPNSNFVASNVKYFVDGKLVSTQDVSSEEAPGANYELRRVKLGETPKIGICVITAQYDCPPVIPNEGQTRYFELYSMTLNDVVLNSNVLQISCPSNQKVKHRVDNESFLALDSETLSDDGSVKTTRFSSTLAEPVLSFSCEYASGNTTTQGETVVERAWIQSWFSSDSRVDRAAFRMRCGGDAISIVLPDGVSKNRVAVKLDKKEIKNAVESRSDLSADETRVNVPLSADLRQREFVLELSYVVPNSYFNATRRTGRCRVQFPQIEGAPWIRRAYWQAIMSGNRHLASAPKNLTPEYSVQYNLFYRRVATASSDELSDWIGLDRRESTPPEANVYLFSSFNMPAQTDFYSFERALLVFLGSGLALAVGLGLVYFPSFRSPLVLFVLSVTTVGVAAFNPTLAALFLQTTILGITITIITFVIAFCLGGEGRSRANMTRLFTKTRNVKKRVKKDVRANGEGS